jgi:FAD/FMN-containing dehydrogenase
MSELAIKGRVIGRGDSDYEATRTSLAWNGLKPDRHPDVIVQPQDSDDIVSAVNYARANGFKVSVRSGGHRWGSPVLREGGMLIDLGSFDFCEIDQANMTARIGPGLRNDTLLNNLNAVGLNFPAGHCSSVPVGGYLLNGGVGWNHATYGPSCFSVVSMEVVTAAGERITVSDNENQDYFWAARGGGGGFFGVVLSYTVRVYPAPRHIQMSTLVFPAAKASAVGKWLQETVPGLSRGIESLIVLQPAPPPLQEVTSHIAVLGAVAFADSPQQADEWLAPFANCQLPDCLMANHGEKMNADKMFALMDGMLPAGKRVDGEALMLTGDAGAHLSRSAELLSRAPSPQSSMLSVVLAPPPPDTPMPDCAFSLPGNIGMFAYAVWDDPAEDANNKQWLDSFAQAHSTNVAGCYIGESRLNRADSSEGAYAPPNWERYCELKRKYDPDNLFFWFLGNEQVAQAAG